MCRPLNWQKRGDVNQIITIILLTVGSVVIGYAGRRSFDRSANQPNHRVLTASKYMKISAMFFIEPISMFTSFWTFSFDSLALASFPFLGIVLMVSVVLVVLFVNWIFQIEPLQAAAMFTAGTFSNILTFGGLAAFILFGVEGYTLILLLNLLIVPTTYFIGYPLSRQIALSQPLRQGFSKTALSASPYMAIPFIAFLGGSILNFLHVPQPQVLTSIRSVLIPSNTVLLGVSIGLTLQLGVVRRYIKEIALIFVIKFIVSPLIMIALSLILGLQNQLGGLPFKIAIIASVMPVGFNALIPPAIYGFDLDLANSAWVASMVAFMLILPIIAIVFF